MAVAMNGGRRITTHEAQVKTAKVEVKALTISGKQVTLSVFRQLADEDIVDDQTATLRGVPWGRVNYYFGECKPDHLHVVWQKGSELRRACVFGWPPRNPWHEETRRAASDLDLWRLVADDEIRVEEAFILDPGGERQGRVRYRAHKAGQVVDGVVDIVAMPWLKWRSATLARAEGRLGCSMETTAPTAHEVAARDQTIARLTECWGSRAALESALGVSRASYKALCAAWSSQYDALAALDQLFIAV